MPESYSEIFQRLCRPLTPRPTGESAVLTKLAGIRAVLFDLYGTLFISDSGEVGTSGEVVCEPAHEAALDEAIRSVGIVPAGPVGRGMEHFFRTIQAHHAKSQKAGIPYPEVDIVQIWREVLAELERGRVIPARAYERAELERLAVEYEARTNPVWPMPGLRECLTALRQRRLVLGIISNAQFYTPELFPALLGQRAEEWGFRSDLQYYSYYYGRAKPGAELFGFAVEGLRRLGIEASAALYVGNDMLNDVLPAAEVGFRTALFGGDARSLRLRQDDPRLGGVWPDLVITRLGELDQCILS